MARFEYQVIPTPRKPRRAKGKKTNADRFAHMLTEEINAQAALGWEFVRSETLPMDERPGMFKKPVETYQTVMVFRREIASDEGEVVLPAISATRDQPQNHPAADPVEPNETQSVDNRTAPAAIPPMPGKAKSANSTKADGYWD